MVDQALIPAIKATIRHNEIGNGSPYVLSFAKYGKSGASFGFMQGDTNVNETAQQTLRQVLADAQVDAAAIDRILEALSRPLPGGDPLSPADTAMVNAALGSAGGRVLVDRMDAGLFQTVLDELDASVAAAAAAGMTLAPIVNLYIAPWVNMTGPPTLLNAWIKGAAVHGVPSPSPPQVEEANIIAYLQASSYFAAHPKNFQHLQQCVAVGAKLLPHA